MSVENYATHSSLGRRQRTYDVLRISLGALLFTAAGLKIHGLMSGATTYEDLIGSPRLQVFVIEVELLVGLLLISGKARRAAWVVALALFALLGATSFYLGIVGQQSCGCLGRLQVSPWWTFATDIAVIGALLLFRPNTTRQSSALPWASQVVRVAAGGIAILVVIGTVFILTTDDPESALAQLRGESVTVEPGISDLGEGTVGESRTVTVWLRNHTNHWVRVVGGTANCKCVATKDLPLRLEPQDRRPIRIETKFTGSPGQFVRQFILYLEDRDQPMVAARFRGRVVKPSELRGDQATHTRLDQTGNAQVSW
jgi:hypothetical protein